MDSPEFLCALLTDADGVVTSQIGGQQNAGEQGDLAEGAGRTWRDVLSTVLESGALPEKPPTQPTSYAVTSADGSGFHVHVLPLPAHSDGGSVVLVQGAVPLMGPQWRRMCSLGMLAAGVAHEFNNLLTLVLGWVELTREQGEREGEEAQYLTNVADAAQQLSGLTRNLLNFARAGGGEWKSIEPNELVLAVLELIGYRLKTDNIELVCDLTEQAVTVKGDEGELSQALLNLIMNARHAMPEGGKLTVRTGCEDGWAFIEVKDTGCGIPSEVQEQIFSPFFTTRSEEGGSGLGLSLCKDIAARHGGKLSLFSEWGSGTSATLRIPMLRGGVPVGGE